MKITRYELHAVPPRWVFLKLEASDGTTGWGEPIVEGRTKTVCAAVSELVNEYVLGSDPTEIERLWYHMYHGDHYRSGPILMSAIAGIDQALWDIKGHIHEQPVYKLLGGPVRDKVRIYQWLSGNHPDELADTAVQAVKEGYSALGIIIPIRPARVRGSEIVAQADECVAVVRDSVSESVDLAVDFRGRVSTAIAKQLLSRLERHDLMFVEEPILPEYNDDLPKLCASTSIPLATGQRMYSRWDFKRVLSEGSVAIVQPAVSHAGGITEVCKIGSMAEAHDTLLMPKCSVGPIAFASAMHVQMAVSNAVLQEQHDNFYAEQNNQFFNYIRNDGFFERTDGFMKISNRFGLGLDIDEEYLKEQAAKDAAWQGPVWHYEDGSVANW